MTAGLGKTFQPLRIPRFKRKGQLWRAFGSSGHYGESVEIQILSEPIYGFLGNSMALR